MKITILMLALVLMCGCEFDLFPEYVPAVIKYEVIGSSADVDVSYLDSVNFVSVDLESVSCNWSFEFTDDKPGWVELWAQNNEPSGTITGRIYVNGNVEVEETGKSILINFMVPDGEY